MCELSVLEPNELSQLVAVLNEFMTETGPYEGFENNSVLNILLSMWGEHNWMADWLPAPLVLWMHNHDRRSWLVFLADMCYSWEHEETPNMRARRLLPLLRRLAEHADAMVMSWAGP